jgi:hypothetical protein
VGQPGQKIEFKNTPWEEKGRESLFLLDFFGFRRPAHGPQTRLQAQTFGRLSLPRLRAERHAAGHAPTPCGQLGLGFRLIHPRLPRLWFRDRAPLQRWACQSKRRSAQAAPSGPSWLRQCLGQRERVQGSSRSRLSEPYLRRTFGLVKLEGRPHRLLWATV